MAGDDLLLPVEPYLMLASQPRLVTLAFTLDQEFSLSQHAKLVTRSCYYQHRQICVITRSLFHGATVVLGHAFVTSRIFHWYAFLGGPPSCVIERHDRVPRSAARPTDHISKCMYVPMSASISDNLRDGLNWLPKSQHISFRFAALAWRCLTGCVQYPILLERPLSVSF